MFDYKKIAFIYLGLSILILGAVLYFTLYKATIIITPAVEKMSLNFDLVVKEVPFVSPDDTTTIPGKIFSEEKSLNETFSATASQKVEVTTSPKVTLINTTNQNQTLIATTRLLTPENHLFRLKNRVIVPAQGQIEAEVYPDDSKLEVNLNKTRLTIPGLNKELQQRIYGQAQDLVTGKSREVKVINQVDLDQAKGALTQKLYEEIVSGFKNQLVEASNDKLAANIYAADTLKIVGSREVLESQTDKTAGDISDSFEQKLKLKVVAAVFDEARLLDLAKRKLNSSIPSDKQLIDIDKKSFNYSVESYDLAAKSINLKVYVDGKIVISEKSGFLDKSKLTGLTKEEVNKYFTQSPAIKSVEIKFLPFWLKRVPASVERITVIINQPAI
ncbi:MAG: hypothetical protein V1892_03470 [bacterium]